MSKTGYMCKDVIINSCSVPYKITLITISVPSGYACEHRVDEECCQDLACLVYCTFGVPKSNLDLAENSHCGEFHFGEMKDAKSARGCRICLPSSSLLLNLSMAWRIFLTNFGALCAYSLQISSPLLGYIFIVFLVFVSFLQQDFCNQ